MQLSQELSAKLDMSTSLTSQIGRALVESMSLTGSPVFSGSGTRKHSAEYKVQIKAFLNPASATSLR